MQPLHTIALSLEVGDGADGVVQLGVGGEALAHHVLLLPLEDGAVGTLLRSSSSRHIRKASYGECTYSISHWRLELLAPSRAAEAVGNFEGQIKYARTPSPTGGWECWHPPAQQHAESINSRLRLNIKWYLSTVGWGCWDPLAQQQHAKQTANPW
mgnify:CR=1 FL=1